MALKFFDNSEKKDTRAVILNGKLYKNPLLDREQKNVLFRRRLLICFIVRYLKLSLRLTENQSLYMLERIGSSLLGYNLVSRAEVTHHYIRPHTHRSAKSESNLSSCNPLIHQGEINANPLDTSIILTNITSKERVQLPE